MRSDLSLVIASCRPKWLARCLSDVRSQSTGNLKVEVVVVAEGDEENFRNVVSRHRVDKTVYKPVEGRWGAFAKDEGLKVCSGGYVAFWDDDNVYHPHAVATLYAAAEGFDVGVVQTSHMSFRFEEIPRNPVLRYGDVDTMCLCVRRALAVKARWSDHDGKGTDFAYLTALMGHGPTVRFVGVSIGEKLEGLC